MSQAYSILSIDWYQKNNSALPDKSISIIIPVYNSATTITGLVRELVAANPGYPLQVVLVNDASVDGSAVACEALAEDYPETVTFLDLAKNAGEHNAVMAGLSHSTGDYCVIMDDDFQNPPGEAFRLAQTGMDEKRDIVYSRYDKKRHHWARNLSSRFANALARKCMGLPDGLYLSSFKCLSRFTVDRILEYMGPFPYVDGLALRVTRNIGLLTTSHEPSKRGKSGYTVKKLFALGATMIINFSILPLRMASLLGFLFSVVGGAGAIYVIWEKLHYPSLPVGWPSVMVAGLLFSGVQLLILGVFGEYLGQMMLTLNGTPQYVVKRVIQKKAQ